MKVLLGIDGSVHSAEAVKHVIAHAADYRAPPAVDLVHVHPPLPRLPALALDAGRIERYYEDEGNAALAWAKNALREAGIAHTAHVLVGPIAETIVNLGARLGSDVIVLGARGVGLAGNLLLGSTVTRVMYFSNIPVLVVKSPASF